MRGLDPNLANKDTSFLFGLGVGTSDDHTGPIRANGSQLWNFRRSSGEEALSLWWSCKAVDAVIVFACFEDSWSENGTVIGKVELKKVLDDKVGYSGPLVLYIPEAWTFQFIALINLLLPSLL